MSKTDLAFRMYIILCRLFSPDQVYPNPSILWKTRRHSEVSTNLLMPHFASNKFIRGKLY